MAKDERSDSDAAVHWHAREEAEVLSLLNTTPDGLRDDEIASRIQTYGTNEFASVRVPGIFSRVLGQLKSPLVLILLIAGVVTLVLGEFVDAGVIGFAFLIAVVVGVLQEGKASRAFQTLADSQVTYATVVRGGRQHKVEASGLVPGDIVVLQGGMQVPADLRILEAKKLAINESALTGEWVPVEKQTGTCSVGVSLSDRTNMAYKGTYAVEGLGKGVVTATGNATVVGEIAGDLSSIVDEKTPLQREMQRVSHIMLYIITTLVVLIFVLGIWQDQTLVEMLLMAIAIAVASIPEGLPAAVTIVLAVGMETLLKRGGLVRNLLAAETLGSTTYVLTDKTGTLTEARMALSGVVYPEGSGKSSKAQKDFTTDEHIQTVLDVSLCATEAYVDETEEESVVRGDPIERAIVTSARELDLDPEEDSKRGRRVDHLAFTSENRFAAGLVAVDDGYQLCVNGAPEYLLESATKLLTDDGERELTEADRTRFTEAIDTHTKEGKRLIAVGYRMLRTDTIPEEDDAVSDLLTEEFVFLGILIFTDPVRSNVAEAIAGVTKAGAEVRLVTGDNAQTALSVARAVGIASDSARALTGAELDEMTDEELAECLRTTHVFARVLPKQKMRLAEVLQRQGEIVAMTGDGINDAPALRRANIGVSVGSGTEVAKEASDLVLVNDSFSIIYAAIEEGRRIVANLRKIVGYLLSTSLSEVVLITSALVTGAASPLVPAQILFANVIEEGLMSFAFAFEKAGKDTMRRRPQDIHEEGILSTQMIWFTAFVITVSSILTLGLYFYLRMIDAPLTEIRSVMFLLIAADSLFIAFAYRSLTVPIWRIPLAENLYFFLSFGVSVFLLGLVLTVPFLQRLMSYEPIPAIDMVLVVCVSFATLVTVEFSKWLFFRKGVAD